ncbi:oxalate/formate MFS antiporter [Herminiimonas arsenitoxidans]|uniref:oxalate/formate MFS antiporter n=1 Tax=Herminiimonas arsenitoxidans TaxID=1809410 RepID=UPI0009707864|nr:oxalate/formate MFS antiporter [Herminiimonas arsenitoxidans]
MANAYVGALDSEKVTGYKNRWMQLVIGIVCMGLVANLQYGWTLFVEPMENKHHWGTAAIQLAFSIFIVIETWLVPIEGWLGDKFGPRPVVAGGAIFAGLGWIMNSYATSLPMLYAAAVVSGIGAGCVYGTCVGNALKWFPDRRGLAAGLTAAGFGAGAAVTVIPIANMIGSAGYEKTFLTFGIIQGVAIFVLALLLVRPKAPAHAIARVGTVTKVDYTTKQMLKTPVFWLIYVIYVLVAAGGVMATAQLGPIAHDFGISSTPISMFGATLPLLTLALSIDNVANGLTRPLCGFISDKIGRENTMFIVFIGEGLALLGLMKYGHNPYMFITFAALIFMFWGEIFSIFPAICGDTFGSKFATANAGTLYTAKGVAALMVPLASVVAAGGNWNRVFILAAVVTIGAGIAAKFVLLPMRKRFLSASEVKAGS